MKTSIRLAVVLALALWPALHADVTLSAMQSQALASGSITSIKDGRGVLGSIVIGTAVAAGTIKVWDLSAAKCTGSPSNPILTLTMPAAVANPVTLPLGMTLENGICVLESSASFNVTFLYQ